MTENEKNSSNNLARRYRHLFRLPSKGASIVFASIPTIVLELTVQTAFRASLTSLLFLALLTECTLLVTIEIDREVLKSQSGIANYRRLSAISIISNSLWLILSVLGLLMRAINGAEGRFIAMLFLGMFFAVVFRAFIFGSVFYGSTIHGLPLSFVQPILIFLVITLPWVKLFTSSLLPAIGISAGLIFLVATEAYLNSVNNSSPVGGMKPMQLLQAFLSAWTLQDPTKIEDILQRLSKIGKVQSSLMKIESKSGLNALLIVPGIHPGPFYPIGSSNLPGDIYLKLRNSNTVPLTVHSISDHELNLPSKSEVENYISSLKENEQIEEGMTITTPVVREVGKATVTGIGFGSTCVVAITQAPHGMEDFPIKVGKEIEEYARKLGFKLTLVIDTHNSEGAKPDEKECLDAINAAKEVLEELTHAKPMAFKFGFAHSSELEMERPMDIGPAGAGLLNFRLSNGSMFCLVVVDANNCKLGFREEAFKKFQENTGAKILELCTSDTHVTAARTLGDKGYLALGDRVSTTDFVAILASLHKIAKERFGEGSYVASSVSSSVRTAGGEILEIFSDLTDATSQTAKRGAKLLVVLGLILIAMVAIV